MAGDVIVQTLRLKDQASPALKKAGDSAQRAGRQAKASAVNWANVAGKMAVMAAGAQVAFRAVKALTQGLADSKNELLDMSTRTGIAADTLGGLRLAAEGSGLQFGNMSRTLANVPKLMSDASKGLSTAVVAFEDLGISTEGWAEELPNADDILRQVLASIAEMETTSERAAAATSLFGASGSKLLQALGDPSNLDHFVEQARSFGVDMGPAAAKAAEDWQRSIASLSLVAQGAADRIGGAFGRGGIGGLIDDLSAGIVFLSTLAQQAIAAVMERLGHFADLAVALMARDLEMIGKATMRVVGGSLTQELAKSIDFGAAMTAMEKFQFGERRIRRGGGGGGGGGDGAPIPTPTEEGPGGVTDADIDAVTFDGEQAAAYLDDIEALIEEMIDLEERLAKEAAARQEALMGSFSDILSGDLGAVADTLQVPIGNAIAGALPSVGAAAAGPIGAAVSQGIDLLVQLGQTGTDAVIANLIQFSDDLTAGIMELPDLMARAVPEFVEAFVPALIEALLRSAVDFGIAMLTAPIEMIRTVIVDLPLLIAERLGEILRDWWDQASEFLANLFTLQWREAGIIDPDRTAGDRAKTAGRVALGIGTGGISELALAMGRAFKEGSGMQTGGFVDRTGIALVHQGERVVPATGASTQTARGMMGGGTSASITINTNVVDPNSIPALVSEIERHFGNFGRGTSPLFQGS